MNKLPYKLSEGRHDVIFQARRDDAQGELKAAIERKYVHIKFSETRGGTEVGFRLDEERSDLTGGDWEKSQGSIHLEGELKLDGVPVRCVADLDLVNLKGKGHLVIMEDASAS